MIRHEEGADRAAVRAVLLAAFRQQAVVDLDDSLHDGSVRIPDAAFQVVVVPGWKPWMVGALVYSEPFWAHDCVGLRPGTP